MLYRVKELTVHIQNMPVRYITFGYGKNVLIMIQGLNTRGIKGSGLSLAYMYRVFSKEYTVYVFDRRPDVYDGITVRDFASDIAMAMDVLHLRNADVIGVSQGGMIAQYLAIDRPDLVNKLVLAVTLTRNNDTVRRVITDWIAMAEHGAMKALITNMAEKMYSDDYIKRYRPFLPLLTILQVPKDVERFKILAKSCLTCHAYDRLNAIQCPALVIGGQKDRVLTGQASAEIAEKIGCEMYMYNHLGHAAYEEAKDFNQRVYDFLQNKPLSRKNGRE